MSRMLATLPDESVIRVDHITRITKVERVESNYFSFSITFMHGGKHEVGDRQRAVVEASHIDISARMLFIRQGL